MSNSWLRHCPQALRKKGSLGAQGPAHRPDSMWGVPLFGFEDERTDFIMLKFLRPREFRVQDYLTMLLKCLDWRKDFGDDGILEEDFGSFKELEGVVASMHSYDNDGHPVCYNAYGIFRNKEMYDKIFGDDQKLKKLSE